MQGIYLNLADVILFVIVIIMALSFVWTIYRGLAIEKVIDEKLDNYIPTAEELATAFVSKMVGDTKIFQKMILPIIGADMKAENEIMGAFIEDNPIITALDMLNPEVANKLRKKPRLILQLPTIIGRINPKMGEILSQLLGGQFNIMGLLAQGDITPEQAKKLQTEQTKGAANSINTASIGLPEAKESSVPQKPKEIPNPALMNFVEQ